MSSTVIARPTPTSIAPPRSNTHFPLSSPFFPGESTRRSPRLRSCGGLVSTRCAPALPLKAQAPDYYRLRTGCFHSASTVLCSERWWCCDSSCIARDSIGTRQMAPPLPLLQVSFANCAIN